ncbi:hypothetical protein CCR75_007805 [Bremia lactucae]|uniref:Uncharacterized protein n=1 Tax=Bremia lactucae TaxID=4779 RepID=A0A976IL56_BRELC|nr:hypothetical protein CCR75_007802 [Bremia lactucae]TDH73806.1 hypothetical protein CCR75_007805 [Bremia lactucae]
MSDYGFTPIMRSKSRLWARKGALQETDDNESSQGIQAQREAVAGQSVGEPIDLTEPSSEESCGR